MEEDRLNNAKGNLISEFHLNERLRASASLVPQKAQNILDMGCGEGYFLKMLLDKSQIDAIGIDSSNANLEFARKNAPKAKFFQRNALSTGFDTALFDCVSALEIIDHVDKPMQLLVEARRVLRDGGALVISFPESGPAWDTAWFLWTRTLGRRWLGEHEHFFKKGDMEDMLRKAGFDSIESKTAFFGMINVIRAVKA